MQFFDKQAVYVTKGAASQQFLEWTCMTCDTNECNAYSMADLDKCDDCESQVNAAGPAGCGGGGSWWALLAAGSAAATTAGLWGLH